MFNSIWPRSRHEKRNAVSVTDNSAASQLNARAILGVLAEPESAPELYELLGRPSRGGLIFPMQPTLEDVTEDYARILESMGHYVRLIYAEGSDVKSINQQIQDDPRFSYAVVDGGIGYSATPNDPLFPNLQPWLSDNETYQWASQSGVLNFPSAWDKIKGWATVGVLDIGIANTIDPSGMRSYVVDHPDLQRVVSHNMSFNYGFVNPTGGGAPFIGKRQLWNIAPVAPHSIAPFAHGTHVVGLIAANSNNGIGISGACWYCSIAFAQVDGSIDNALAYESYWGAQVVNFSGFVARNVAGCGAYTSTSDPHCQAMALARAHDLVYVVSSGNNQNVKFDDGTFNGGINFPARDPVSIAVGGLDVRLNIWDEHYPGVGLWLAPISGDYSSGTIAGCPDVTPHLAPQECGSNTGAAGSQEQDFVAPARRVLSTVPPGTSYRPLNPDLCNDSNFGSTNDGYALCTGTSMAAPLVSGIAALIRSVNPLLERTSVYESLKKSASPLGIYTTQRGWGIPDAGVAVDYALGKVGGSIVKNRLTPMFAFTNSAEADRLYTTRPQVAIGALSGIYLTQPLYGGSGGYCDPISCATSAIESSEIPRPYVSSPVSEGNNPVAAFENFLVYKPTETKEPRSAFWVFTSERKVWKEVAMKPLFRLSFAEECDWRDHIYTADPVGVDVLTGNDWCYLQPGPQPFQYDAIEGYILAECPPGYNCDNPYDSTAPQRLYRRYSSLENSNALLTASQLGLPAFWSYYNDPWGGNGDGFLGYVFPNVDSDGDQLPDGLERLYGMNWLSSDSDCDGIADGIEFPFTTLQASGADPLSGSCP